MGRYIPHHALQNLKMYQYKGVDKSILSRYVLNPYWNQLVKLWPKSVAPNTITLTGLSLVFINFLTLLYYDPYYLTSKDGAVVPNWVFFSWAAGLFLYQSLDAIDGKQARRTQMAGPLGEMFDHGCDAINTSLEAILACYALNLGRSWWTVASQIATLANFYLTTWEEYHTGQLYLGVFSGPVEGILMIVGLYVITGIYGPSFWDQGILTFLHIGVLKSLLPDLPLNVAFMYFGAAGLAFNIVTSYRNVLHSVRSWPTRSSYTSTPIPGTPSRPSSSSPTSPLTLTQLDFWFSRTSPLRPFLRLLPFPVSVLLQVFWLSAPAPWSPGSKQSAIINSPLFVPFLLAWGFQLAHQVGRMILAHLTKRRDMPFWEWLWVWTALWGVDANLPWLVGRPPIIQTTPIRTTLLVLTTLFLSLVTYARFVYHVIDDITNFLGIACFTVRKRDKEGVWRRTVPPSSPGKVRRTEKVEDGKIVIESDKTK